VIKCYITSCYFTSLCVMCRGINDDGDGVTTSVHAVPERIKFRLCVLTYRCLHGTVPSYLAKTIRPVSGLATRRHLRSADTSTLLVPTTRRSTLGDHAFPAAAARAWNSLPCHVRDMPLLIAFRRELKTVLFRLSYPVDR